MADELRSPKGPLHVTGEVLATKKSGAYRHLTITAPGIPQRFRAGNFVAVSVDDGRLARRALWIHRVKESGAFGPTLDVVVRPTGRGSTWLAERPVGSRLQVTGPLGRPFALPREPVACVLVGEGHGAAPMFPLAERLRERGVQVHVVPLDPAVMETRKDSLGVASLFKVRRLAASLSHASRVAQQIRRIRPALVHTNSLKADLIGGMAARLARVPLIWHVRDRIAEDYLPPRVVRLFRWLARWLPTPFSD